MARRSAAIFIFALAALPRTSGATSPPGQSAGPAQVIDLVEVRDEGARTIVTVRSSGRPVFTAFRATTPNRVVLDVSNARLQNVPSAIETETSGIEGIGTSEMRAGGAPLTRVLVNLREGAAYQIERAPRSIVVTVTAGRATGVDPASQARLRDAERRALAEEDGRVRAEERARQATEQASALTESRAELEGRLSAAENAVRAAETARRDAERLSTEAGQARTAVERAQADAATARAEAERARREAAAARAEAERRIREAQATRPAPAKSAAPSSAEVAARAEAERAERVAREAGESLARAERARVAAETQRTSAERRAAEAEARSVALSTAAREADEARARAEESARGSDRARRAAEARSGQATAERRRAEEAARQAVAQRVRANADREEAQETARLATLQSSREAAERARAETQAREALERSNREAAQRIRAEEAARVAEARSAEATEERRRAEEAAERAVARSTRDTAERRHAEEEARRARAESERAAAEQRRAQEAARRAEQESTQAAAQRRRAEEALAQATLARQQAEQAARQAETRATAESRARAVADRRAQAARRDADAARQALEQRGVDAASAHRQVGERIGELERARAAAVALAEEERRARIAAEENARTAAAERARAQAEGATAARAAAEAEAARRAAERAAREVTARQALADTARRDHDALERRIAEEHTARTTTAAEAASSRRRLQEMEATLSALQRTLEAREDDLDDARGRLRRARTASDRAGEGRAQAEARARQAERARDEAAARAAHAVASRRSADSARVTAERERYLAEHRAREAEARATAAERARVDAERARAAADARATEAVGTAERARREAEAARAAMGERSARAIQAADAARVEADRRTAQADQRAADAERTAAEAARDREASAAPPPGTPPAAPASSPASSRVRDVRFDTQGGFERVVVDLTGSAETRVRRLGDRALVLELEGVELPEALERTLDVTAFDGAVHTVSTYRPEGRPGVVLVEVELGVEAPQEISHDGSKLVWTFHAPRTEPGGGRAATVPGRPGSRTIAREDEEDYGMISEETASFLSSVPMQPRAARGRAAARYRGRRIDLDFKDADIHNILRLVAEVGRVNIVTSDDVSGTVTIRMRNVPWDQALDVILQSKGLGMERQGNLIRVAPLTVLEKEREMAIARRKQQVELEPLETRLIPVSYATASELSPRAQELLSSRGSLSVDDRTNVMIARDVADNLNQIEELVRNLDTQTPQVLIEARIVEANSNYLRELGIQWGGDIEFSTATGNPTGLGFPANVGVAGGATDRLTETTGLSPISGSVANPNFAVNLPAAVGRGSGGAVGISLGSITNNFNLNLRLSALEATGSGRIISEPRILTLDNREAHIEQGTLIPYSQVSAAGVQTAFQEAKLNLTVRPHVTADGSVLMHLKITRDEPDFNRTGARGDPTINKREAETELLIEDGRTAVIGGIYTRNSGLQYNQVPFFANIPVLGWFFRNQRQTDLRGELLIFITPRIVNRAASIGQ